MRLPKQLKYWLRQDGWLISKKTYGNNYLLATSKKKKYIWACNDKTRHLRVLSHTGVIEICDGFFDRWANSGGLTLPIPRNKKEFDETMNRMAEEAVIHTPVENIPSHKSFDYILDQIGDYGEHHSDMKSIREFIFTYDKTLCLHPFIAKFHYPKNRFVMGFSFLERAFKKQNMIDLTVCFLPDGRLEMFTDYRGRKNPHYRICEVVDFISHLTRLEKQVIVEGVRL